MTTLVPLPPIRLTASARLSHCRHCLGEVIPLGANAVVAVADGDIVAVYHAEHDGLPPKRRYVAVQFDYRGPASR